MTPQEEVNRAQRAKNILDDPLFKEAREQIEAEFWRLFRNAAVNDAEALQQIKCMQYMHGKYFDYLGRVIQNGKLAEIEIERVKKKTLKERLFNK